MAAAATPTPHTAHLVTAVVSSLAATTTAPATFAARMQTLAAAAVTVVGQDGQYLDPGREDREVDEAIFRAHPFLPMWGDDRAPPKA